MAIIKLVNGKDIVNDTAVPTPFGVMFRPTGLVMPGNTVDVCVIPWERIASFTFADQINSDGQDAVSPVQ